MNSVKLSQLKNDKRTFLYGGETVGLEYVLRMIWNNKKLPKIELCYDENNFEDALTQALSEMSEDTMNGVERDSYPLHNLKTVLVEVDITKSDIRMLDEEGYEFEII